MSLKITGHVTVYLNGKDEKIPGRDFGVEEGGRKRCLMSYFHFTIFFLAIMLSSLAYAGFQCLILAPALEDRDIKETRARVS